MKSLLAWVITFMVPLWKLMWASACLEDNGKENPLSNCVVADENALSVFVWDLGLESGALTRATAPPGGMRSAVCVYQPLSLPRPLHRH